mmetsp:Transcript_59937/g.111085  ORF Transcript_59937/g.111085 Transcript_59937/m.111085 type:complete len:382 (-) Transcript_59937:3778-4923(-)
MPPRFWHGALEDVPSPSNALAASTENRSGELELLDRRAEPSMQHSSLTNGSRGEAELTRRGTSAICQMLPLLPAHTRAMPPPPLALGSCSEPVSCKALDTSSAVSTAFTTSPGDDFAAMIFSSCLWTPSSSNSQADRQPIHLRKSSGEPPSATPALLPGSLLEVAGLLPTTTPLLKTSCPVVSSSSLLLSSSASASHSMKDCKAFCEAQMCSLSSGPTTLPSTVYTTSSQLGSEGDAGASSIPSVSASSFSSSFFRSISLNSRRTFLLRSSVTSSILDGTQPWLRNRLALAERMHASVDDSRGTTFCMHACGACCSSAEAAAIASSAKARANISRSRAKELASATAVSTAPLHDAAGQESVRQSASTNCNAPGEVHTTDAR